MLIYQIRCFHFTCFYRMDWGDPVPGWRQCWREFDDLHGHEGCLLWDPDPGWDHGCLPCGLGEVHPLPCTYPGSDGPPASCGDHDEVPGRWVLIPWYVQGVPKHTRYVTLFIINNFYYIYLTSDYIKMNIIWEKNMHEYRRHFHVHVQVSEDLSSFTMFSTDYVTLLCKFYVLGNVRYIYYRL